MKNNQLASRRLMIPLAVLVVVGLWLYPKVQQERLNGALIEAVNQGEPTCVQALLAAGADPDTRDGIPTALILASDKDDEASVRFLLAHRANVNATGAYKNTALHIAIGHYYRAGYDKAPYTIRMLLANGADTALANSQGQTSWDEAKQLHNLIAPDMRPGWHDEALPLLNKTKS